MYNHEIHYYRQFVWILDLIRQGRGWGIPRHLVTGLGIHLWQTAVGFLAPVAAALLLLFLPRRRRLNPPDSLGSHMALYFAGCAIFWTLVGFHQVRLTVTQYPAILYGLGLLLCERTARPELWLGAILVLQVAAYCTGLIHRSPGEGDSRRSGRTSPAGRTTTFGCPGHSRPMAGWEEAGVPFRDGAPPCRRSSRPRDP